MTETESRSLSGVIRQTWRELALADQSDADALLEIIKQTLEKLEELETAG